MPDSILSQADGLLECPVCGILRPENQEVCPRCGEMTESIFPVTDPLKRPEMVLAIKRSGGKHFASEARVILQFLPSGQCVQLNITNVITLGRRQAPNSDDFLDLKSFHGIEQGVSRHHCILSRQDDRLMIRDLGSTNGTYLNGELLPPHQDHVLAHGDRLTLAKLHIMVFFNVPD